MKVHPLPELRETVQSPEFTGWWTEFVRAGVELGETTRRAEELMAQAAVMDLRAELVQRTAIDTLSRAGELENDAGRLAVEAQELENRSMELLVDYEEARFKVSDLWYRLGAAERVLEDRREALEAEGERPEEPVRTPRPDLRTRLGFKDTQSKEYQLKQAERTYISLREDYERESIRKGKVWVEVQRIWARTFELTLLMAERRSEGPRLRRESERLFKEAEERKQRGKQLRQEADAAAAEHQKADDRRAALLAQAGQRFDCVAGERFLYWRQNERDRSAFAVALCDDAETYNIDIKSLAIYSVSRQRGVGFLELARDGVVATEQEGDRRFEDYFLGPRKGLVRAAEPGSGAAACRPSEGGP
jgi:hypothetical protein